MRFNDYIFSLENLLNVINSGIGLFICHARTGGHPVYWVLKYLDSCLRRNDGHYRKNSPTARLAKIVIDLLI